MLFSYRVTLFECSFLLYYLLILGLSIKLALNAAEDKYLGIFVSKRIIITTCFNKKKSMAKCLATLVYKIMLYY